MPAQRFYSTPLEARRLYERRARKRRRQARTAQSVARTISDLGVAQGGPQSSTTYIRGVLAQGGTGRSGSR